MSPALAWLWPLVFDGFIVVASMSVVRAVIESRRAWHPWVLLLLFSTISVAGNVAHGPPTAIGRLVAAAPPVALVLAFDLLMRQVQLTLADPRIGDRGSNQAALRCASEVDVPAPLRPGSAADDPKARVSVVGRSARLVARAHATGQPVTGRWLAEQLSVSDGYARRLLRQINAADSGVPAETSSDNDLVHAPPAGVSAATEMDTDDCLT